MTNHLNTKEDRKDHNKNHLSVLKKKSKDVMHVLQYFKISKLRSLMNISDCGISIAD